MIRISSLAALSLISLAGAASITVNPAEQKQTVEGFGGGSVYYQSWITAMGEESREALFDTAFTGLNLSLLRLGNWLQDESKGVSEADVAIVTAGKKRLGDHMKIEMSSWSAPGSLKGSGSVNGNDGSTKADNTLKKEGGQYVYNDFAAWWKRSLEAYTAAGIKPDYISLQNEPDMNATYEETLFDPSENDSIAGYAEALNAVYNQISTMQNRPKILGPEPLGIGYNNFQKYAKALNANQLDGYAYHIYHAGNGNDNSGNNYLAPENFRPAMKSIGSTYNDKPIIMTEFCNMLDKTREADMVGLAHIMQVGFSDGYLAGYIAWELFWGGNSGQMLGVCAKGWGDCTADEFFVNPEYHAMRHYSKFVNPGWKVISASTTEDALKTVAFSNTTDSVTVVVINTGDVAIKLDNPTINGMNLITAVQSKENGFKSKEITLSNCSMLPAKSVTTLVYSSKGIAPTATACSDETTDQDYHEPVIIPTEDVVLVDYSTTTDVSTWSKAKEDLGDVTYVAGTLDGITGYASVPLAGCEQSECGYKSQLLKLSDEASAALASCSEMVITMRSAGDTTAYVNVGAAAGSSWIDYQYGRAASASTWSETTVNLEKEGDNGSNSLTFNSDAEGIYIAKIVATGCATSPIKKAFKFQTNDSHLMAHLFDMNGNLVWKGTKAQALNDDGSLRANVRQGTYLLKTRLGVVKAIKK